MISNIVLAISVLVPLLILLYLQVRRMNLLKLKINELNNIVNKLENSNKSELAKQLNLFKNSFTDLNLLVFANRFKWNKRVVNNLPRLFFEMQGRNYRCIVWKKILNFIPKEIPFEILDEYCNGEVVKISVNKENASIIHQLISRFENARIKSPYLEESSLSGVINQALIEFELEEGTAINREFSNNINNTRMRFIDDEINILTHKS